jgi:hypothetical protein
MNYLRERYPFRFFLPLAAALTAAAFAGGMPRGQGDIFLCWITAFSMVFQFRLWDDLGDLPYDRIHHPQRVLCRASLDSYIHIVGIVGVVNTGLLMLLGRSYVGFALLNLAALAWYGGIAIDRRRSFAGRHVTLLKYPFIVLLIAPQDTVGLRSILAAVAVYLACSAYEVLHDSEVRAKPAARALMWTEVSVLTLGIVMTFSWRAL